MTPEQWGNFIGRNIVIIIAFVVGIYFGVKGIKKLMERLKDRKKKK